MHSSETIRDPCLNATALAVILAAGEGARLACQGDGTPKVALSLLGLSLAERTITSCMAAGIQRFLVVLGRSAEQVRAHYQGIAARRQCDVDFVTAQDWKLANGASALAAANNVGSDPFLLTMSDHVIAPSLIAKVLRTYPQDGEIALAVDRWRNSEPKHRWLATAIRDVEPRLRTVAGYRHLPRLRAALQSSSNRSGKAVA